MLALPVISVPKAADVLAGILREKILNGQLAEGADLPNERDLGLQSGLSRAATRCTPAGRAPTAPPTSPAPSW